MKIYRIYLSIIFVLLINCAVESQWIQQYVNNDATFYSMMFTDSNIGYAAGGSLAYGCFLCKTTNGGTNWNRLFVNLYFPTSIYDLYFINNNTGFMCGHTNYIYKSTNGGINWFYSLAPAIGTQTYSCIQFLNEQTGYLAGRYGMISKTTDGGLNWFALDTTYTGFSSMYFHNVNTGFLGNTNSGIYKTTDGGNNWEYKYVTGGYVVEKIKFANNLTGYAVGGNVQHGAIFKTTNNGDDWFDISFSPNNPLLSLYVNNEQILFCGGENNIILKSTDGGITWSNQQLPSISGYICSMFFMNQDTGFCANYHYIHKTSNGGSVFIGNNNQIYPDKFELYQNYPNPFNSITNVKFEIINSSPYPLQRGTQVVLRVFDLAGRELRTPVNERLEPGVYEVRFEAGDLPSGVYFYRMEVNGFSDVKRMVILK